MSKSGSSAHRWVRKAKGSLLSTNEEIKGISGRNKEVTSVLDMVYSQAVACSDVPRSGT